MLIQIDRTANLPLYVQIRQQMRELILTGALPPESRLPATRDLARALGVNRTTIITAYRQLWSEGLVEGRAGGGTVVIRPTQDIKGTVSDPSPLVWEARFTERIQSFHAARMSEMIRQTDDDVIKFCLGTTVDGRSPVYMARDVLEKAILKGTDIFQSAPYAGIQKLRRLIAKRMELSGINATPSEVLILSNRDQGIYLLTQALLDPGDRLALEVPTYAGALHIFDTCGARLCPVPLDEDGPRLDVLEGILIHQRPKLLYMTPTFRNPTGTTMSLTRRCALLELAHQYGVPILEEDPYYDLRYEGRAIAPIKALDRYDHVIYLSTYSETFFPNLPLAWMIAPKEVVDRLLSLKACIDEFTSALAQHVVYVFLQEEMEEISKVISFYSSRRDAMCTALERHCRGLLRWRCPEGGFFIWAELEGGLKTELVLAEALKEKVAFVAGWPFFPGGKGGERVLRLDFAGQPEDKIKEGIRRLGIALQHSISDKYPQQRITSHADTRCTDPFLLMTQSMHSNL